MWMMCYIANSYMCRILNRVSEIMSWCRMEHKNVQKSEYTIYGKKRSEKETIFIGEKENTLRICAFSAVHVF